jgi:Transposase DDE domain
MYVAIVPNRSSRPAILLRESYRDGAKVKNRTLANLSDWPAERIETLRAALRGDKLVPAGGLEIVRALPHGHVAAALGKARRIGLDDLLPEGPERRRKLALALIVARLIDPAAKLATARALDETTAIHSLGVTLGLGVVNAKEVYAALDWLGAAQPSIETALARQHLRDGTLVLYDVSSSYVEGRCCELARFGHSRDGRNDKMQIVFGLLCSAAGGPIAVEVFEGNTGDPSTLGNQIAKLKQRFGLKRVVLVGDRGMITQARIDEELKPAGLDWVTALRAPAIQHLAAEGGPLQPSLFDERDLAEIESPDFPGERLVVCKNPALAEERKRKRDELLDATEQDLKDIQARIVRKRQPLRGTDKIGLAVGALLGRRKVAKHFRITITDDQLSFTRDHAAIAAEAALDGFYVLRTNVPADALNTADTVRAYKSLASVERAFRSLKTVDLDIRPIFHWVSPRVRAHVLVCSSDCSWFRRVAGGRRYDLRRLGIRATASSDDICSSRHAVVPAMSFAA